MTQIFKPNIHGYKVLTPTGYQQFTGVALMGYRSTVKLEFDNAKFIECTSDHKLYITDIKAKQACRIKIGETVLTEHGSFELRRKTKNKNKVPVYDLIGVKNGARFYANSILVSNCTPIIFEETLINPLMLRDMEGTEPIDRQGQIRWYKRPNPQYSYVVALDPSLGTGGDAAAIQVLELPTLHQVAEWKHNTTIIQKQIALMVEILEYLSTVVEDHTTDLYYSIENNTIGEAGLVVINEIGEENIKGMFLTESSSTSKRYRRGFATTAKTKTATCAKLKSLIEQRKLRIYSKPLISELKNFIAHGTSYAAKVGQHDDLVMSLILAVRMVQRVQKYDVDVDDAIREGLGDDLRAPMPFLL